MSRDELLKIKLFTKYCDIEYGYTLEDLKSIKLWELIQLMIDFHKCPWMPYNKQIGLCIKNRSLHD